MSSVRIGDRVVVRRAAGIIDGRQRYTDVLGELLDDSGGYTVRRDDGEVVTIPAAEVAAAKAIPPKPTPFSAIIAVERGCADTWPAPEQEWLGDWLLRAGSGWTYRANSVLPLGEPGLDLDAALAKVTDWYTARALAPAFAVPVPLSRRLATALTRRGWRSDAPVEVMTAPLSALSGEAAEVTVTDKPGEEWFAMATGGYDRVPDAARAILGSGDDRGFAEIRRDGRLIACGRGAISGGLAVLSRIEVDTSVRRQGLGRQVMAGLAAWAGDRDADTACVQVVSTNGVALALYEKLGFTVHHRYVNLVPPLA
ncbi:GNAT family N-acetyltransferase [Stackebrandtia nassauensis]|nr:GNAT family N-acetyltransferase [Stackebrandtia nassauensis]